jgi:hypothetical protein
MDKLTKFKSFKFNYAVYDLVDYYGNKYELIISYKSRSAQVLSLKGSKPLGGEAHAQIMAFARDLLKRKSGKEFIEPKENI